MVIPDGVNVLLRDPGARLSALKEVRRMPIDKQKWDERHGRVVNCLNHYCNTLSEESSAPDLPNKKGTIAAFKDYPTTDRLRHVLTKLVGAGYPLVGELNHYFDHQ